MSVSQLSSIVITGASPTGETGAGNLVNNLYHTWQSHPERGGRLSFWIVNRRNDVGKAVRSKSPPRIIQMLVWHFLVRIRLWLRLPAALSADRVLLLHFAQIGFFWTWVLLKLRRRPTDIYVFDSSFFCIRSYNYIPGETQACVRCLGQSFLESTRMRLKHHCRTFPVSSVWARILVSTIRRMGNSQVHFLAQNQRQEELVKRHVPEAKVVRTGMWTTDLALDLNSRRELGPSPARSGEFDVVFHGSIVDAKGYSWVMELAKKTPELRYLIPSQEPRNCNSPRNVFFRSMRWESGLKEAVRSCPVTLVPSLWSSPVEAALVKSLWFAPSLIVAHESTALADELNTSHLHFIRFAQLDHAVALIRHLVEQDRLEGRRPSLSPQEGLELVPAVNQRLALQLVERLMER